MSMTGHASKTAASGVNATGRHVSGCQAELQGRNMQDMLRQNCKLAAALHWGRVISFVTCVAK